MQRLRRVIAVSCTIDRPKTWEEEEIVITQLLLCVAQLIYEHKGARDKQEQPTNPLDDCDSSS